eukprot:COSAG06_NODE_54509_length_294_cov_0.794872_1_plen_58_part_10
MSLGHLRALVVCLLGFCLGLHHVSDKWQVCLRSSSMAFFGPLTVPTRCSSALLNEALV